MNFYLGNSNKIPFLKQDLVILEPSDWDDWFTYSTVYNLYYYNSSQLKKELGSIKIGQKGMGAKQRRPDLPDFFVQLDSDFFSLGQDVGYYEVLNDFGELFRDEILTSLNDIAYDKNIYESAIKESVTRSSLLRFVSPTSVEGQFRRLAQGNAELTPYRFQYYAPKHDRSLEERMILDFNVIPNTNPPTNIHVIIGRNGVGKTHLFNNMIITLLNGNNKNSSNGYFVTRDKNSNNLFANLVSVSFSAFDETNPIDEKRDKTKYLNYSYIGLKRVGVENKKLPPKSPTILKNEFVKSIEICRVGGKNNKWIKALEILESDPIFKEAEVSKIAKLTNVEEFKDLSANIFNKLSSGHKTVLLTITRLVETIEERSLVLLDEPEGYLHPPLLSAFIRALSDLLISRNAVGIIGTHSPVVLQEVPKSCVWKLRRSGANAVAERPEIESFGENVGLLTQEVFGLEVTDSGFHKILQSLAQRSDSYREAIDELEGQLGFEGKAILRNLLYSIDEKNR